MTQALAGRQERVFSKLPLEQYLTHHVPVPLKDELAVGILERFGQINGVSARHAIRLLRSNESGQKPRPDLWLLAHACGIEEDIFTSRHSMVPVMYPLSSYYGDPEEAQQKQTIARRGFRTALTTFRWCTDCSRYDFESQGFSYLRRTHQIDGVHWCIEHRIPLLHSVKADVHPTNFVSMCPTSSSTLKIETEINNPAVLRLEGILAAWLQMQRPLHLQTWSQVVGERCRALGLRVGEIGKRDVASDWIADQFPDSWLSNYFPDILTKSPRDYVRKVDGACVDKHVSYPGLACATIMAVLYPSSDDAVEALNRVDTGVRDGLACQSPKDRAILAFMRGESLQTACSSVGAQLSLVEGCLREICRKGESTAC